MRLLLASLVAGSACTAHAVITVPFLDDFNDNTIAAQWAPITDNSSQLNILEQNGRVEMLAPNSVNPTNDALFISNGPDGFRLLTSADFRIQIDYSFTSFASAVAGARFALVFGIGRDLPDGTDSAAIGFGYATVGSPVGILAFPAGVFQYRVGDVPLPNPPAPLPVSFPTMAASGTLFIEYTTSNDTLTLGQVGNPAATYVLPSVVVGEWAADDVYASFGARGAGIVTASGDAWFDNFRVVSGVPIPEPSSALLLLAALPFTGHRRRR